MQNHSWLFNAADQHTAAMCGNIKIQIIPSKSNTLVRHCITEVQCQPAGNRQTCIREYERHLAWLGREIEEPHGKLMIAQMFKQFYNKYSIKLSDFYSKRSILQGFEIEKPVIKKHCKYLVIS